MGKQWKQCQTLFWGAPKSLQMVTAVMKLKDACFLEEVQFSRSVVSDSLQPHRLQHARLPCPSPVPGACPTSCPSSRWCHPVISSSVIPFSSCLQSFPASGSFPISRLFSSGGQSIGTSASASVLPMNIQNWFPLGLTGLISFLSKRLSSTTVQKHQFFGTQSYVSTLTFVHDYWKKHSCLKSTLNATWSPKTSLRNPSPFPCPTQCLTYN